MQPILRNFLDKWVYPTGFSGPGVDFRMRQTDRCLAALGQACYPGDSIRRKRSQIRQR